MYAHAKSRVHALHTSDNKTAAIRQENMATSFSKLRHVEGGVGVAGQVVQGSCFALSAIVHLHVHTVPSSLIDLAVRACKL